MNDDAQLYERVCNFCPKSLAGYGFQPRLRFYKVCKGSAPRGRVPLLYVHVRRTLEKTAGRWLGTCLKAVPTTYRLNPVVFRLLREHQHLGGYRRLGTPPRYPPPATNRGHHHGTMLYRAHARHVSSLGLRARSGTALASGEVSRVRALPIRHAPTRNSTSAPGNNQDVVLSMDSAGPGLRQIPRRGAFPHTARAASAVIHRPRATDVGTARRP